MARDIVTSENREEYIAKKMGKKSEEPKKTHIEKLRMSHPTEESLAQGLSKYLGGATIKFEDEDVYNAKGLIPHYKRKIKKGRHHLYELFENKE